MVNKSCFFLYNENIVDGIEECGFWLSITDREKCFFRIDEVHFHYRKNTKYKHGGLRKEKTNNFTITEKSSRTA